MNHIIQLPSGLCYRRQGYSGIPVPMDQATRLSLSDATAMALRLGGEVVTAPRTGV